MYSDFPKIIIMLHFNKVKKDIKVYTWNMRSRSKNTVVKFICRSLPVLLIIRKRIAMKSIKRKWDLMAFIWNKMICNRSGPGKQGFIDIRYIGSLYKNGYDSIGYYKTNLLIFLLLLKIEFR